ncbi:hypothetical protein SAMN06296010_2886 [Agreia pratensis]|uniref:Uncharacterized protein n=1 Tax=Agreia pratensis TaxID=150121 RepID=A0A1X7KT03_9MICO|nr:hypothetical protein SAMN06296010_2886 [Agreia pratensis]
MISPPDYTVRMFVRVKSIDLRGHLVSITTPYSKGLKVHAEPWNQPSWWVHLEWTGETRLFAIDEIELVES